MVDRFTARDVVFTVKAAQDKKTIFNSKSKYRFIKSVQAIGDYQVQFRFIQPKKKPEELFNFKIIPAHALEVLPSSDSTSSIAAQLVLAHIGLKRQHYV